MGRPIASERFQADTLDAGAGFFAWVTAAAAAVAVALLVVAQGRDGASFDRPLGLAINAVFARLPAIALERVAFDEGLAEVVLVVGLVAAWNAGRVGRLDRAALRERVLLAIAAFVPTYLVTRTIQHFGHAPRPIRVLPLHPLGPLNAYRMAKAAFSGGGSFPSDHAALSAIAAVLAFSVAARAGWFYAAFGTFAAIDRVAVGYHWTSDVLGGALVGICVGGVALALLPRLTGLLRRARLGIEEHPVPGYVAAMLFLGAFGDGFSRLDAALRDLGVGKLFH